MRLEFFSAADSIFLLLLIKTEVILTLINLVVYAFAVYVIWRAPFHFNLRSLLLTSVFYFYLAMITRLITLFGILGFFPIRDDPTEDFVMVACSYIRMFFFCIVTFSVWSLYIERRIATIFLADYECKPRRYIGVIIFFYMSIGSGICAALVVFELVYWEVLVVIAVLQSLFIALRFWCLERHNKNTLRDINKGRPIGRYSLSLRFQLEENLRTMKLMRITFIMLVTVNVVSCGIYMISHWPSVRASSPALWQTFEIIFNIVVNLDGYLVPLTVLVSDDTFKKILKDTRYFSWIVLWWKPHTRSTPSVTEQGTVYFTSLQLQWEQHNSGGPPTPTSNCCFRSSRTADYWAK